MNIIKKGSIKPKETKETCHKCKTHFSYIDADIKSDRDCSYVECPVCKAFIATKKS